MMVASVRVPLGMLSPGQDGHRGWATWSCSSCSPPNLEKLYLMATGKLSEKGGMDHRHLLTQAQHLQVQEPAEFHRWVSERETGSEGWGEDWGTDNNTGYRVCPP